MNKDIPMVKCAFCTESVMKFGKLHCPWNGCIMAPSKIVDILDKLSKVKGAHYE